MRVHSWLVAVCLVSLAAFGTGIAVARTARTQQVTTFTGSPVSLLRVATSADTQSILCSAGGDGCDTGWQDITGATLTVSVPKTWTGGLILVRFNAIGTCHGEGNCAIRILLDGSSMSPAGTYRFAIFQQYSDWPLDVEGSLTMGPGSHTVQVQGDAMVGTGQTGAATLTVANWTLSAERAKSRP